MRKIKFTNINQYTFFGAISLVVFLVILPLSLKVNFLQNDDWNRTLSVTRFLQGDFSLYSFTATTFYTQGVLGMIWAYIFGISKLPILTLLFSVGSFFVMCLLVFESTKDRIKNLKFQYVFSLLVGLLFFLNPFNAYSTFGFMTEVYLQFFVLLALLFFIKFLRNINNLFLVLSNIFFIFGFYAKQNAFVFPLATAIYFVFNKKNKLALIQTAFTLFLYGSYELFFPKTLEMITKDAQFWHLTHLNYIRSILYGSLIVVFSFLIPLVIASFDLKKILKNKVYMFVFVGLGVALYYVCSRRFNPEGVNDKSSLEYPYFGNTFFKSGFFSHDYRGTKYNHMFWYDLYNYWSLISKFLVAGFASYLIMFTKKKKLLSLHLVSICLYLGLMLLTETFFDRYLLLIIPSFILFIVEIIDFDRFNDSKLISTLSLYGLIFIGFLSFMLLYSYNFSMNFVLQSNYTWSTAQKIIEAGELTREEISVNRAWGRVYGSDNVLRQAGYATPYEIDFSKVTRCFFSYDNDDKNPEMVSTSRLIEKHRVDYPLNFFVDPYIYFYCRE